ncbi:hypothetical protein PC9H_006141 [Pleurotus ostreatus]|uniref:Pyrroloquinoline quinone-dependent pyranose dehydrogenase beta-propeller domain-containing protein n=1 Tax=Pleurotus ostreatus TaxID=5322 RepID=A0A8H6ZT93_PLEOS|nr:uncharacterized protein PC9H_006141 [Pleurotus ostreatus]KAF7430434.1 hypothetical protein PC9H_006141 [Pleurotus ostreatus]KAJ8701599.1 hypothetical protein PTI98_000363 [Pleurotus ostreatus]
MLSALVLVALAALCAATFQPIGAPFLSPVTTAPGFAAQVIFSNLTAPRGIAFDDQDNLLVVERGLGVTAFTKTTQGGASGWERTVVISDPGFTHAIEVDGSSLFVSTASEVRLYKYDSATKTVSGSTVVVNGLPADGELTTHALLLYKPKTSATRSATVLFVGSGPLTNIDPTARDPASGRSQVRGFKLSTPGSALPQTWLSGELIAYGIRNPAGFAIPAVQLSAADARPGLFILENGASIDDVPGFTPKFVNDNPADELELVAGTGALGRAYGFPDCTTLWNPTADPVGNPQYVGLPQGAQFSLNLDPLRNDAWCGQQANNVPPSLSFQAHSVPLDIKFYEPGAVSSVTSFPTTYANDAFVSFRGSFNRDPPTGYGVVHVPFPITSPTQASPFIVQAADLSTCPGTCIRPVGLSFSKDGRLYVSSDSSRELFVVQRGPTFTVAPPGPTLTIPFPTPEAS